METSTKKMKAVKNINKPAYVAFLAMGLYFMVQRDFGQAASFWGIALIFDPFNTETPFKSRPKYQQLWLFVHLSITLALFILMFVGK